MKLSFVFPDAFGCLEKADSQKAVSKYNVPIHIAQLTVLLILMLFAQRVPKLS